MRCRLLDCVHLGALSNRVGRLQVDLQHLPEEYAVLVLYFRLALLLLQFTFLVPGDVGRLWRLLHIDARLHIAQTLHVHKVVFNPLSFVDVAVGRVLDPHVYKNGDDLNYNQFQN